MEEKCKDCIFHGEGKMCLLWKIDMEDPCRCFVRTDPKDTFDKIVNDMKNWEAKMNGNGIGDNAIASENEFDMLAFAMRISACQAKQKKVE